MHIGAGTIKLQQVIKWDVFWDTMYIYAYKPKQTAACTLLQNLIIATSRGLLATARLSCCSRRCNRVNRRLHRAPWFNAAHNVIRTHSRIGYIYCNGLLLGLPCRLQDDFRSAHRLVISTSSAPRSATMHDALRWLDFLQRITNRLSLMVFCKCLHRHGAQRCKKKFFLCFFIKV